MTEKKTAATKAIENEAAEAETTTITVHVCGKDFELTVPASVDEVSFDAAVAVEDGKYVKFVGMVVDPMSMARLRNAGLKRGDAEIIADAIVEAWGMGGNA